MALVCNWIYQRRVVRIVETPLSKPNSILPCAFVGAPVEQVRESTPRATRKRIITLTPPNT